jgi:hypothetical protein
MLDIDLTRRGLNFLPAMAIAVAQYAELYMLSHQEHTLR